LSFLLNISRVSGQRFTLPCSIGIDSLKNFLQFRSSTLIMSVKVEKEAATAAHMEETTMNNDEKNKRSDYSGAVQKTDAAEIALVRKLDMRIMPALFCMYFL
jgi:hypothetical protein